MTGRRKLPGRRRSEVREFRHNGQTYSLGTSHFPGTTQVAEVFLSAGRPGSEVESVARDAAIITGLALQFGCDLATLRHAVTRADDGSPSTAIGQALDLLDVAEIGRRHDFRFETKRAPAARQAGHDAAGTPAPSPGQAR